MIKRWPDCASTWRKESVGCRAAITRLGRRDFIAESAISSHVLPLTSSNDPSFLCTSAQMIKSHHSANPLGSPIDKKIILLAWPFVHVYGIRSPRLRRHRFE